MPKTATDGDRRGHDPPLAMFACPNPDCDRFNQFDAGNLSVCERMGKDRGICRLYCNHCGHRFSKRQGSLMEYTKDFHQQQLERLKQPLQAVELDELYGRVNKPPRKKGRSVRRFPASRMGGGLLDAVAAWVGTGFTRPWRSRRGS